MKNYFTLERFSLLYDHYAFIDAPQYYADQLFIQHMMNERKFKRLYRIATSGYISARFQGCIPIFINGELLRF